MPDNLKNQLSPLPKLQSSNAGKANRTPGERTLLPAQNRGGFKDAASSYQYNPKLLVEENHVVCALLSLATLGIFRFFTVPQGYVRFVTLFGKFVRYCLPGLGRCLSLLGLYERPTQLVPTMEQVRDYPRETVFTRDGVQCVIDSVVFFTLNDPFKAVFEVQDYEQAIRSLVQAALRNECGNLAARELLSGRQKLADLLRTELENDTAPWGITVRLVEITDINMSPSNPKA